MYVGFAVEGIYVLTRIRSPGERRWCAAELKVSWADGERNRSSGAGQTADSVLPGPAVLPYIASASHGLTSPGRHFSSKPRFHLLPTPSMKALRFP